VIDDFPALARSDVFKILDRLVSESAP